MRYFCTCLSSGTIGASTDKRKYNKSRTETIPNRIQAAAAPSAIRIFTNQSALPFELLIAHDCNHDYSINRQTDREYRQAAEINCPVFFFYICTTTVQPRRFVFVTF